MDVPGDEDINRLTIVLPWPDKILNPNEKNGKHWAFSHAAKTMSHKIGWTCALQALAKIPGGRRVVDWPLLIACKLTFVAPDRRRRDLDNLLSIHKPHLDGIALALKIDDSRFRPLVLDDAIDANKKGFVLVELG